MGRAFMRADHDDWLSYVDSNGSSHKGGIRASHWMPLPAAPMTDADMIEAMIDDVFGKIYAHCVIKYDPEAAKRVIRDALRAENARMRETLEPFAKEAENWADDVATDYRPLQVEPQSVDRKQGGYAHPGSDSAFSVGDLRRARSELEGR